MDQSFGPSWIGPSVNSKEHRFINIPFVLTCYQFTDSFSFSISDKTTKIEVCVLFLTKMSSAIHSFNEEVFAKHHHVPGPGLSDVA